MRYEHIPTKRGELRCSNIHGAKEKAENIKIAKHFAEKYGHKIDLLPISNDMKTADTYNHTLSTMQEYKTNFTPTKGAIDSAIRSASKQADSIVLNIESDISSDLLMRGIKGRVAQTKSIKSITILRNGEDVTYSRNEILNL